MSITIYIFSSVILVSLVSFIGIISLLINKKKINNVLLYFVSLSAGTLFGGAFLHLIPESIEKTKEFSIEISSLILLGIITFFILDKLIHWRHSHENGIHKNTKKSMIYLNLVGDGIHNFLDGLVIAGSYFISIPTGIAATIAVILHEIPQEIADFGILIYSGLSKWKALFLNSLSALLSILGAVIGISLSYYSEIFTSIIVPFAAGSFIYIAGSNLIPELLRKKYNLTQIIKQLLMFILGIFIMYGLLFI